MAAYVLSTGPLSICLGADDLVTYTKGILSVCNNVLNHCIQAVGVNFTAPIPYWIMRNQWGTAWGINGFAWIKYGSNLCDITTDPIYTTVAYAKASDGPTRKPTSTPSMPSITPTSLPSAPTIVPTAKPSAPSVAPSQGYTEVTIYNWFDRMNLTQINGPYTPFLFGSIKSGNVTAQLMSPYVDFVGLSRCDNVVLQQNPVQKAKNFHSTFEIMTGGDGYMMWFSVGSYGSWSLNIPPAVRDNWQGGFAVVFNIHKSYAGGAGRSGVGIYLVNQNNTVVASAPFTNVPTWHRIEIFYHQSSVQTWTVICDGVTVISYNDVNNAAWVRNSGDYWTIGAGVDSLKRAPGSRGDDDYVIQWPSLGTFFVRRVTMHISPSGPTMTPSILPSAPSIRPTQAPSAPTVTPTVSSGYVTSITTADWQDHFKPFTVNGKYPITKSKGSSSVEMQLAAIGYPSIDNLLIRQEAIHIHPNAGFRLRFEVKVTGRADTIYFFVGANGPRDWGRKPTRIMPQQSYAVSININPNYVSGYKRHTGAGIYLIDGTRYCWYCLNPPSMNVAGGPFPISDVTEREASVQLQ